jgi:hypothetical protein
LHVSLLVEEDRPAVTALLDQDPLATLYLRSLVFEYGLSPTMRTGHGRFFGARRRGGLVAVVFMGNARNLTTWGETEGVEAALERGLQAPGGPRLFVGPAEHAGLVRRAFARTGASPFLDRDQAYYVLTPGTLASLEDVSIRPARASELDAVGAAHAAMTEEDLLIPRVQLDFDRLRQLARQRIAEGKIWVIFEGDRLVFKTEESARAEDGILVGGVFTDPLFRGRGLAARGIAAWADRMFAEGLRVMTLHVNASNTPAVRAYERVGFRRHSMLRLMLAY